MDNRFDAQLTTDVFGFLSVDNLSDFIKIVKSYPKATPESNVELLKRYNAGDIIAFELLLKTNLRLIVSEARKLVDFAYSYEFLDLIQEGSIGFLKAVNTYDLKRGIAKFSTYACTCISHEMMNALRDNDRDIRRPGRVASEVRKYKKMVATKLDAGEALPDDEEACKELKMSKGALETAKNDSKFNTVSLDSKVNDDEDACTYSNFISDGTNISGQILDDITQKELFVYLKRTLPAYHYYVLMMRAFKKATLAELASIFGLRTEAIRQIEIRVYSKVRSLVSDSGIFQYRFDKNMSARELAKLDVSPIQPNDIIKYMFFRDLLTEIERKLFRLYIEGNYIQNDEIFAEVLGLDANEYLRVKQSLVRKTSNMTPELREAFKCFRTNVLNTYGTKIFKIDWDMDFEEARMDAKYVATMWDGKSYEEVMSMLREENIEVSHPMDRLLRKYFDHNSKEPTYGDLRKAEREVNSIIFGFKKKNDLPLDRLYDVLIEHKAEFSQEQYMYLMMKVFNRISKKKFLAEYPNSSLVNGGGFYVVSRLEAMYFGITSYRELNFTREKYELVRDLCCAKMPSKQVNMLDYFYGVTGDKLSIQELADMYGVSYDEMRFKIKNARDAALSVYLDKSSKKTIEYKNYIPYIENMDIDLNDKHRDLLRAFMISGDDYEKIAVDFNMSRHDVSSNILDGIMKIDFYRFGILKKDKYPVHILQRALGSPLFSPDERKIIKYVQSTGSRQAACEEYGMTVKKIDNLMSKYVSICYKKSVESIEPTEDQIRAEVTAHISERVLNDNERLVLAELYGVRCEINPSGMKFELDTFKSRYPDIAGRVRKILKSALEKVAGKSIGLERASLAYMDRATLKRSLLDPRIPISDKERELLYYSFELNGYPYKTLDELQSMYGERATSLKRRIQRAFVTINKYEDGEIPAVVSLEYDVEPYLKYFAKADREILLAKYRDKMTYAQMEEKFGLTYSQVESLVFRLDAYLRDLLDGEATGFDFDYFYETIENHDLPYYDDLETAKAMFDLYYEKRMSISEIAEELNLDVSYSVIQRTISNLMITVLKRREGIKKANVYTYEDVINYYQMHEEEMDREQSESYYRYFRRVKETLSKSKNTPLREIPINPMILLDLIKANNESAFNFETSLREDVLSILQKHKRELSDETISTLVSVYDIRGREFMSSKDQRKVLKLLAGVKIHNKIIKMTQAS